jgi:hypothetical protein
MLIHIPVLKKRRDVDYTRKFFAGTWLSLVLFSISSLRIFQSFCSPYFFLHSLLPFFSLHIFVISMSHFWLSTMGASPYDKYLVILTFQAQCVSSLSYLLLLARLLFLFFLVSFIGRLCAYLSWRKQVFKQSLDWLSLVVQYLNVRSMWTLCQGLLCTVCLLS